MQFIRENFPFGSELSLVCVGNTLIVGESCTNSAGASGARLLAFDVTPKKPDTAGLRFKYTVIQDTGIEKSPNGASDKISKLIKHFKNELFFQYGDHR
ncbi:hypothetical protein [Undibacterium crateris]|uniref:hypothetical protein n=1 Tax=Undibacterium crateris TaxID=2528175 RepID=UPI00192EAA3B|nr:hypothetical protein [Undibacterium crateris]